MRIAQIAPPWISVPPQTYGGTEFIVSLLTEELTKRGHEVTLFATGDSKTEARFVPIWPKGLWKTNLSNLSDHHVIFAVFSLLYNELINRQDEFDIIHDHCEFYSTIFSRFLKPPVVSTVHRPMYEEIIILFKKFPKINYVAISKNQKKTASGVNFVKVIYNGIPIERYPFQRYPEDYLLWISRIVPEKGVAEAIEIAKGAGEKLIIAGIIPKEQQDYFEYRLQPMIDGKQIQFVGAANFEKKVELFKKAKALLYPIKRPEPFGLVVAESMACGTPVIAYKEGAMPELIRDGKTGFLVRNQEEMIEALKRINQIDRLTCRRYARRRFSHLKMVNKYEALYNKILKERKKNGGGKTI